MKITFRNLTCLYLTSLLFSSLIFSFAENKSFLDSFYWSCTTSTTTGYGDILPTTTITKVLFVIMSHFWVFFCIPCVVALLLSHMIEDQHKFSHDEQEWIKHSLSEIGKRVGTGMSRPPPPSS